MAWEDRTPAQKRQARKEALHYRRTDDNYRYEVTTPDGTRFTVNGINDPDYDDFQDD